MDVQDKDSSSSTPSPTPLSDVTPSSSTTSISSSPFIKKFRLDNDDLKQDAPLPASPPPPATPNPINNECQSWQETKTTIKDRTSCLVNSERLSDVIFLVGQNETPIYGHKTILSAGSPYFEKLFYGPMADSEPQIRIPDIEPEVFLSFLKYLYTDEFDTSMDDVDTMHLLQPAKVYIVPHLAEKCTELLMERISPENVLLIYNRALVFDEPKLAMLCLRFLDRQIDKVIATEAFLDIDLDTLATLLERENLRVDECSLFKACLRWTEMECSRKGVEAIPVNRREALGRGLYLLRFPTMAQEDFCLEVVPTEILTQTEIISIFMNLCIGNDKKINRPPTPFSTELRVFRPKLHYLNRFSDVLSKVLTLNVSPSYPSHSDLLYSSKLRFRCDQRIFVHGLGAYGIASPVPNTKFNVTATICKGQVVLSSRNLDGSGRSYDFRMPFQVMFPKPIEVLPDDEYLLTAVLKIVRESFSSSGSSSSGMFGPSVFGVGGGHYGGGGHNVSIDSYYGSKGRSQLKVTCSDGVVVNFTFMSPTTFHVAETFSLGQIPQIIFSV